MMMMARLKSAWKRDGYTILCRALEEALAKIDLLQGALEAQKVELFKEPAWAVYLSPQERIIMGMLVAAHPNIVTAKQILKALPHSNHADSVRSKLSVQVCVSHIRSKLGRQIIQSTKTGWVAGEEFMENECYDHQSDTAQGDDALATKPSGSNQRLVRDHPRRLPVRHHQ
jgi:DNA-binding response OmpR family regulator